MKEIIPTVLCENGCD